MSSRARSSRKISNNNTSKNQVLNFFLLSENKRKLLKSICRDSFNYLEPKVSEQQKYVLSYLQSEIEDYHHPVDKCYFDEVKRLYNPIM